MKLRIKQSKFKNFIYSSRYGKVNMNVLLFKRLELKKELEIIKAN